MKEGQDDLQALTDVRVLTWAKRTKHKIQSSVNLHVSLELKAVCMYCGLCVSPCARSVRGGITACVCCVHMCVLLKVVLSSNRKLIVWVLVNDTQEKETKSVQQVAQNKDTPLSCGHTGSELTQTTAAEPLRALQHHFVLFSSSSTLYVVSSGSWTVCHQVEIRLIIVPAPWELLNKLNWDWFR